MILDRKRVSGLSTQKGLTIKQQGKKKKRNKKWGEYFFLEDVVLLWFVEVDFPTTGALHCTTTQDTLTTHILSTLKPLHITL